MKRGLIKLLFFLTFVFVFANFASAAGEECFITDRASCESNYIIMGLSNTTNAHGELASQANYDYVLCCNFAGSALCTGTNKVLGLSSDTNAHAQIPSLETYASDVCYSDLECINTTQTCGQTGYNLSIVSLTDDTNAHIGGIGDYNTNICCTSPSLFAAQASYWSNDGTTKISSLNAVVGTTSVKLILKNSEKAQGENINFSVYENDLFLDDFIKNVTGSVIDGNGTATAQWTVNVGDLEKTPNDYSEFYFIAEDVESEYLKITIQEISVCADVAICSNYNDESSCGNDICNVASSSAPSDVDCDSLTTNCYCSWESGDGCNLNADYIDEVTQETIGTCKYNEDTGDDCSDGFLSFSWIALWTGNEIDKPLSCIGGSKVIECPTRLKLPFFGFLQLFIALLIIFLVYFSISNEKSIKKKIRKFIK